MVKSFRGKCIVKTSIYIFSSVKQLELYLKTNGYESLLSIVNNSDKPIKMIIALCTIEPLNIIDDLLECYPLPESITFSKVIPELLGFNSFKDSDISNHFDKNLKGFKHCYIAKPRNSITTLQNKPVKAVKKTLERHLNIPKRDLSLIKTVEGQTQSITTVNPTPVHTIQYLQGKIFSQTTAQQNKLLSKTIIYYNKAQHVNFICNTSNESTFLIELKNGQPHAYLSVDDLLSRWLNSFHSSDNLNITHVAELKF